MVLQIFSVLVPLAVAVIGTLRWPTLHRRTQAHVQLLKDLPEGTGKEFRNVVEAELDELARQARDRLATPANYAWLTLRLSLIAAAVILSGYSFYSGD